MSRKKALTNASSGRTTQLETLFRNHYRGLFREALAMLHSADEAHDAVCDVFVRLLQTDQPLRDESAEAYLWSCVRRECLNRLRHLAVQERIKRLAVLPSEEDNSPSADQLQALWQMVDRLQPPVCQEVIRLHFYQGLTFREVASQLHLSETAVYKHLRRALEQLRQLLKPYRE